MPKPLTLKAATMAELKARAVSVYGPHARVVHADKVTPGSFAGLFAASYFEGVIEIVPPAPATPAHGFADLTGIETLLAQAGAGDDELNSTLLPEVSTRGERFDKLMTALNAEIVDVVPPPPALLEGPGDLVLVAGPGDTALQAARAMAAHTHAAIYTAGLLQAPGIRPAEGPHQTMEARAAGVIAGQPVIIAFGLGNPGWAKASAATAAALKADQAWLAVDARLKHEDTTAWVQAAAAQLKPAALAVAGVTATATPSSVNALGIPVGWVDERPAAASLLTDPDHR